MVDFSGASFSDAIGYIFRMTRDLLSTSFTVFGYTMDFYSIIKGSMIILMVVTVFVKIWNWVEAG